MNTTCNDCARRQTIKKATRTRDAGASKVLRYARRFGWSMARLPNHGAILGVLARIIDIVEGRGMRLGRWRCGFYATYAVFVGNARPRSYSRHGWFAMHTYSGGGVCVDSQACHDLSAYEQALRKVPDSEWDATRKQAMEALMPEKGSERGASDGKDGVDGPAGGVKPCDKLGYCPYGILVEQFPPSEPCRRKGCDRFGHLCPAFVVAECIDGGRDGMGEAQGETTAVS